MRHSPSRRRSGFTFIEMLVVFVLVGAVMAISVRGIGDTLRRDRVAKTSAILSSDFEQAFAIAARQREPVRILIRRDSLKLTIQEWPKPPATPRIYKTRLMDSTSTYAVDSMTTNRDTIDIMPNGLATDSLRMTLFIRTVGGTLYTKSVRVSKGGLVRLDNR